MVQSNEFQLSDIDGTFEEREYLNKDENESHKEVPEEETKNKGLLSYFSLYKYSTPIEKLLIATGIILAVVCGMAIPGMMYLYGEISGDLIDYVRATSHVTTDDDLSREQELLYSKLRSFVISTVICGLVTVIFGYFSEICFRYTAVKQVTRMRKLLLSRMLNADIEWHDLHKTTDFTTIFTENLSKIEEGLGPKMCLMICNASNFTTSIILAFHQGWLLTLASLSLFPLMLIIFWIMSWVSAKFSMDELEAYGAAGSLAEEVFSAIKTVVAFDAQKSESLRYQEHLQVAKNNNIKKSVFNGLTFFFTDCFSFLTYVITLGYGAKLVADDMLLPPNERLYTPSVCIIVINCITGAEWKFHEWIPMLEIIGTAVGAGVSVFSMLDIEPVINKSKVTGIKPSKIEGNLKFKNVEFSYHSRPGVKVLKGINFEINKGETVALVGHSGCGKSTIIQLIQRCYDPIEGNIELDGNDLKDLNLVWWRNQIGIVSQEPVLFDTTILENIRIANPDATVELIVNAAKKANAHNFISRLPHGYQTQIGEGGTQLSGGQKQRVAIARALIKKPRILLLDEATSALDTTSEAEVQAALDQIAHECTTIIVAHRLSTIRNADRIVVMEDGQIKEQGTHDELMLQQGVYYNLTKSHKSDLDESKSVQEPELDEEKITSDEMNENLTQKSPKLNTQGDGIVGKEDDMDEEESIQESCSVAYTILKYNKPEWHLIFFGCLCAMSSGAQFPVIGYILGEIIKYYGVDDGDYIVSNTKRMIIYLFISAVVAGISSGLSEVFLTVSGERLTFRLRKRMYEIMVNEEIGWHDREENGVGAICAKLSSTASYVQGASGARIGTILTGITIIIISCTISLAYNWKLALVCLSFSPIIIISSYFEHRVAVTDSETSQKILEKSAKIAVEALSNIRTVVTIGCETVFYDLYVKELEAYRQLMYRRMHLKSITEAASWSLLFFSCAAGMAYGTKLTVEGSLDSSNVFTIIEVVFTGSWAAGLILSYSSNYQEAYNAAKIVINLLERRTNTTQTHGSAVFQKGDVKYENVNFSYPTRPKVLVLEGLNLHAAEGKTVALVGGSGNGKSTVVQLLLRYYDPSSGHIYLGSQDIGKCPSSEVRRRLGVVSQEPNLFDRTIAENIAYGDQSREVSLSEIVEAARIANIHDFIGSLPLGYQTRMGHKGTQLSGGQKQRVAIARALIRKPDILLLDEATSALDNESEKIVQEALDKAREGRTCLTIAHRLTTIIDADLICVIQDGRVVETGTHAELLEKKGAYYECYKQN